MQNIPIALAEPDMVLAKDVKRTDNPDGPPVCGKGMVLTESLIERLQNMGIQTITVEGHPIWMSGDKTLAELLEILDRRFKKVGNDPLMMRLRDIYRAYLEKSMGENHGR